TPTGSSRSEPPTLTTCSPQRSRSSGPRRRFATRSSPAAACARRALLPGITACKHTAMPDRATPPVDRDSADGSTRAADVVAALLRSEGVDRVFGNPGTTELPLLDAFAHAEIPFVLGLQEGSVVAMADGYARGRGVPAVASLHIAAGLANGIIGLLNAR